MLSLNHVVMHIIKIKLDISFDRVCVRVNVCLLIPSVCLSGRAHFTCKTKDSSDEPVS